MKVRTEVLVVRRIRFFSFVDGTGDGYAFTVDEKGKLITPSSARKQHFQECLSGVVKGRVVVDEGILEEKETTFYPSCSCCDKESKYPFLRGEAYKHDWYRGRAFTCSKCAKKVSKAA